MSEFRILNAKKDVVDSAEFDSNEQAYDWFKEQPAAADDSLGYGLETKVDGEWQFVDQTEGGTNTSGADNYVTLRGSGAQEWKVSCARPDLKSVIMYIIG
ncbi:MAG TPA: hypothetical protein H9867_10315 [Candidatus Corynebacterium gallistercoris]|uniref:Uncharacterized protein n=1 Tax=Candidatus Corynebacterium gallistercoris TaxID=2838530 RepID=A0A9D1S099_9CORY|nr:hypothetical protein [Candidatus Corynebacterium gallistercoris]